MSQDHQAADHSIFGYSDRQNDQAKCHFPSIHNADFETAVVYASGSIFSSI